MHPQEGMGSHIFLLRITITMSKINLYKYYGAIAMDTIKKNMGSFAQGIKEFLSLANLRYPQSIEAQ